MADRVRFYDDVATRTDPKGRRLSDRIWRNQQLQRRQIDTILRDAIRNGDSVDSVATKLTRFINPVYAQPGDGRAEYAATRLARTETSRTYNLSAQDTALTDPASGFLRYRLNRARHIKAHDCDEYAAHDQGLGKGVWPALRCPLPPQHPNCQCEAEVVSYEEIEGRAAIGMDDFVEQLRAEYDLADPDWMTPEELAIFRRETQPIREAVQFMFRAWFEQTGLASPEQLIEETPTVREWIASVLAAKRRRRGR